MIDLKVFIYMNFKITYLIIEEIHDTIMDLILDITLIVRGMDGVGSDRGHLR